MLWGLRELAADIVTELDTLAMLEDKAEALEPVDVTLDLLEIALALLDALDNRLALLDALDSRLAVLLAALLTVEAAVLLFGSLESKAVDPPQADRAPIMNVKSIVRIIILLSLLLLR